MSEPVQDNPIVPATTAGENAANTDAQLQVQPNKPNPNIKLPPAAARLPNLEFDPLGNPYYKFPPFLPPPEGVVLVSFEAFQPSGIELVLDPDEDEYDGMGIPTVMLGARHVPLSEKDREKKKKKKKNKDDEGKIVRKESTWWEDWAEGEDLRKAEVYDPNVPRSERFIQGATEFQHGRHWKPATQSVFDHFRHYCGLKSNPSPRRFGRRDPRTDADAQEEEDDEAEFNAEMKHQQQAEEDEDPRRLKLSDDEDDNDMNVDKEDPEVEAHMLEMQAEIERRELRMDNFLNDPDRMVRIFFSSFYKEKGLFWSKQRCRDGPLLLKFFFHFFIRNRIMLDYQRAFEAALRSVNLASVELPLSARISVALPDAFGSACTALWGSRMPQPWQNGAGNWNIGMEEDANKNKNDEGAPIQPAPASWHEAATEQGIEMQTPGSLAASNGPPDQSLEEWEAAMRAAGAERIDISTLPPLPSSDVDGNGWGTSDGATWGAAGDTGEEGAEGWWGNLGTGSSQPQPMDEDPTSGWEASLTPPPCLISLIGGPTSLPITHAPALIEKSTRRILDFSPPDASAPAGSLNRKFGIVKLAPWKIEEGMTGILPPEVVRREGVAAGTEADATADVIKVYVAQEAIEVLREGMGIFGLWVRVNEMPDGEKEEPKEKKEAGGGGADKKKRKKKAGKGKDGDGEDKVFWYIETVFEVIPSFWTEAKPHEIVEGT